MKYKEGGYIALLTVLIIGAAAAAISLALVTAGADSQRSALVELQSKQARALAAACAQEALQQIHDNIAYTGANNVTQGAGSCTYTVTSTSGQSRTIIVTSTVGSVVRKIQAYATIGTSSISISLWQETS
jgi:type II secretory pathway component PulK